LLRTLSANAETLAPTATAPAKRRSVRPIATLPVANFIDSYIGARQQKAGVEPTGIAGDEEFLRRVTLDLTGQIPDPAALEAFVADRTSNKRDLKIEELLASDAFVDRWTMWLGDLVQNVQWSRNIPLFYPGRNAYTAWMREAIRNDRPYDQMVRELVSGKGDSTVSGTANYVARQQLSGIPQDLFDNIATDAGQKFLGMPLLCVSCHNGRGHLEPVNAYLAGRLRYDLWRMSAFFSRVDIAGIAYTDPLDASSAILRYNVTDNLTGRYDLNTTDGNKSPRVPPDGKPGFVLPAFFLTGEEPRADESYRDGFARMLTANRQFARASVNYFWKEMFGLGLVEPVSGFDLAKLAVQPTHPELLEALTDDFIAKGFSLKSLLRTITRSNTYQLAANYAPGRWNETWVPLYARHYPRRLMAEMLFDAISKSTGVETSMLLHGAPAVTRAMQLPDPLEPRYPPEIAKFLGTFGRGDRDQTDRTSDGSILQALAMMNDPLVTNRVLRATWGSTVGQAVTSTSDPDAITEQLYLATLSRKPTAEERQIATEYLRGGPLGDRAEDLQYALLMSLEFLFN
jgi:hypothetical protein